MGVHRLSMEHTGLLVVDPQEKLLPVMRDGQRLTARIGLLIDAFATLGLPIVATEQYRKGLGPIVPELSSKLPKGTPVHEKLKFSACIEPVRQDLVSRGVRQVLVCGIEAHVCVLQTCLELVDLGFVAAVALDAISSRREIDQSAAERRMIHAGVVPTTAESAIFELVHEAGTERFKSILPLVK